MLGWNRQFAVNCIVRTLLVSICLVGKYVYIYFEFDFEIFWNNSMSPWLIWIDRSTNDGVMLTRVNRLLKVNYNILTQSKGWKVITIMLTEINELLKGSWCHNDKSVPNSPSKTALCCLRQNKPLKSRNKALLMQHVIGYATPTICGRPVVKGVIGMGT